MSCGDRVCFCASERCRQNYYTSPDLWNKSISDFRRKLFDSMYIEDPYEKIKELEERIKKLEGNNANQTQDS